VEGDLFK